jgi:T-complex protein 1 subunit theta
MGLSPTEVIEGYELALEKSLQYLEELKVAKVEDLRDVAKTSAALKTSVCSKQFGYEDFLAGIIAKACIETVPETRFAFNVDNVRVSKIMGSTLLNSEVVKGMVMKRDTESYRSKVSNGKVVVYSCPIELLSTETKGTVLITNAEELKAFSKGEELEVEKMIKQIVDTGVEVVVTGGKVHDLALHYLNLYNIMVVRVPSKFDLRRLARVTRSTTLTQLVQPTPEELGFINEAYFTEIGETNCVVMKQVEDDSRLATIVIRGATDTYMDDIERAIDDGVNTYKALSRDNSLVVGGGAAEIDMSIKLQKYTDTCPGMEQYAIQKFAEALEVIPKALAENTGVKAQEMLSQLYAAHQSGSLSSGVDINSEVANVTDVQSAGILDSFYIKYWALRYATKAACTVLQVDQIIMAKQAGGPKAPAGGGDRDDD